jgi:hypothetical protein
VCKLQDEVRSTVEQIEESFPYMLVLFGEWAENALKSKGSESFSGNVDQSWLWHCELVFFIRSLRSQSFSDLGDSCMTKMADESKSFHLDRAFLAKRVKLLDRLLAAVERLGEARLRNHEGSMGPNRKPRVVRLAERYKMADNETRVLQLLVVMQGTQSQAIRNHIAPENGSGCTFTLMKLAAIAEIDLQEFYEDSRQHVKEGLVIVDEELTPPPVKLSPITIKVLLGRTLTVSDTFKLSKTQLENLLASEEGADGAHEKGGSGNRSLNGCHSNSVGGNGGEHEGEEGEEEGDEEMEEGEEGAEGAEGGGAEEGLTRQASDSFDENDGSGTPRQQGRAKLGPYSASNQLEYLEDQFQIVALKIRASAARMKEDMKRAGTKHPGDQGYGGGTSASSAANAGRGELLAKARAENQRLEHRLQQSREAAQVTGKGKGGGGAAAGASSAASAASAAVALYAVPRLEVMAEKFQLSTFEKQVVVLLIGKTISPVVKTLLDQADASPVQVSGLLIDSIDASPVQVLTPSVRFARCPLAAAPLSRFGPSVLWIFAPFLHLLSVWTST